MTILLSALLIVGAIVAAPGLAVSGEVERHSGTVVSVNPVARTLVLQELGVAGREIRLEVRVPDGVAVVHSERLPDDRVTRLEAPFADRRIDLADVRPGDFVVVEGAARGGSATASLVVVTLRAGARGRSRGDAGRRHTGRAVASLIPARRPRRRAVV
jgi:hypothetical protein